MSHDKYKTGESVRIVLARAYPHLTGTVAQVVRGRAWCNARGRGDGERYQIFAYQILACDGGVYSAEQYTLAPWVDPKEKRSWVEQQRADKITVDEFSRSIGWKPKAATHAGPRASRRRRPA